MASPDPKNTAGASPSSAAPETLARVVLRCRELAGFLESAVPLLPARAETPFLYGQLDAVLQRLNVSLRAFGEKEGAALEKGARFLRRLSGKKPREAPRKTRPCYDLEGNAWTIPVTELVGFLSHSGKTGLLWVTSPVETFVLEFARGSLVHATSNAPPVSFRLGEILLKEKLLEPAELERVLNHARSADDLLGSFLVRSGRLRHEDLQRALAIQVQQLFHRLMDAENALYRFQEGAQLLRSHGLEVNITQLLLESARKKDEERLAREGRRTKAGSGLGLLEEMGAQESVEPVEAVSAALPVAEADTTERPAEASAPEPEPEAPEARPAAAAAAAAAAAEPPTSGPLPAASLAATGPAVAESPGDGGGPPTRSY
jgi:hypothetical protein